MRYEVILDAGETANKCTIAPLSGRADFRLMPVKGATALGPLTAPVLLHHEGKCLTELKGTLGPVEGIAAIDCVWRRLDPILSRLQGGLPVFARIPEGFETAYPRRTADNSDPSGGLATIEAIFVGAALLGHWDASLLSEYYFGRKFIEMNAERFLELGVWQAGQPETWPGPFSRPRNALQRRRDRGTPVIVAG